MQSTPNSCKRIFKTQLQPECSEPLNLTEFSSRDTKRPEVQYAISNRCQQRDCVSLLRTLRQQTGLHRPISYSGFQERTLLLLPAEREPPTLRVDNQKSHGRPHHNRTICDQSGHSAL